ncbi:MAG TPA: response regulator transcription factor [Candidatus Sulfomarinibacteraceae bacterium]|nr:response regulator transcription factor [Candidatus Sulfomarinibacteraceae bacterium]
MIQVLIADDFPTMIEAIRKLIATYDDVQISDEVTRFEDVVATIDGLEHDVILMNDYLPPLDSPRATKQLREMGIETPILVMSMHEDARLIRRAFDSGANGFILKTEFLEQLLPAIKAVYAGERYLSPTAVTALADEEE